LSLLKSLLVLCFPLVCRGRKAHRGNREFLAHKGRRGCRGIREYEGRRALRAILEFKGLLEQLGLLVILALKEYKARLVKEFFLRGV
jgi:hypothetical protein